jgi:hypothetical protein
MVMMVEHRRWQGRGMRLSPFSADGAAEKKARGTATIRHMGSSHQSSRGERENGIHHHGREAPENAAMGRKSSSHEGTSEALLPCGSRIAPQPTPGAPKKECIETYMVRASQKKKTVERHVFGAICTPLRRTVKPRESIRVMVLAPPPLHRYTLLFAFNFFSFHLPPYCFFGGNTLKLLGFL